MKHRTILKAPIPPIHYATIQKDRVVEKAGLKFYPERMELIFGTKNVSLSKKEADIVESLMERYPRVAGREDLLEKLWEDQSYVDENTLNVNITRVRKKFQEIGLQDVVETVRGVGYRLNISWKEDEHEAVF